MFQIIKAGIDACEPQYLGKKEMEIRGQLLKKVGFRLHHANLQLAFLRRGDLLHRRAEYQTDVIQNYPGQLQPSGSVSIEIHFAVTVVAKKFLQTRFELG